MSKTSPHSIDAGLLKILVCPLTRSPLTQEGDWLIGRVGGLRYPIREGIPILLIDEAKLPDGVASMEDFRKKHAGQIPV